MQIITTDYYVGDDLTLICDLEYHPADPGQPDPERGDCCPPSPAECYLIKACIQCVDGCMVDVTQLISDDLRDLIEITAGGDL